jgi:hypothetical protein
MVAQSEYPSSPGPVARNNAQERGWGTGWPDCQASKMTVVELVGGARVSVRHEIAVLVRSLLNYCSTVDNYVIRREDTGGFNCRAIAGTTYPSNHSWGLAVDVNWRDNPMSSTTWKSTIPPRMVSVLWAFGFFWGGWYGGTKDPMHFEFVRRPQDVPALEAKALRLWEAVKAVTPQDIQQIAGAVWAHVIGSDNLGVTSGADWWIKRGEIAARGVGTVIEKVDALAGQIQAPAPVQIDYAQLAAALKPVVHAAVAEVLARTDVEIVVNQPSP